MVKKVCRNSRSKCLHNLKNRYCLREQAAKEAGNWCLCSSLCRLHLKKLKATAPAKYLENSYNLLFNNKIKKSAKKVEQIQITNLLFFFSAIKYL